VRILNVIMAGIDYTLAPIDIRESFLLQSPLYKLYTMTC